MKTQPMSADLFPSIELEDFYCRRGFAVTKELNETFVNSVANIRKYKFPEDTYYKPVNIWVDRHLFIVSKNKVWGNHDNVNRYLTPHEIRHVMDFVNHPNYD